MRKIALLLSLASVLMVSCSKEQNPSSDQSAAIIPGELNELDFPTNFDFNTSREIRAEAVVHSLDGNPLAGTRISFYNQNPELGAKPIAEGVSDASGRLDMPLTMPAYSEQVYVVVHSSGFANSAIVPAKDFTISFGGKPGIRNLGSGKTSALLSRTPISGNYYYIGTFSSGSEAGLPNYLENPGDVISQELLDDVDASLPESAPVPSNNPSYLTVGNELDLVIEDQSDVWVTFVTEGAGYKNALGYYVFDSQNPPATVNDIDSIFVVLPNASLDGAGGKLQAGDKVKLGTFDAGKTISWVLFQNAWNGSGVNVNSTKYYSRIDFNTMESDPSKRQHTVQLADIGRQILIVGFEDQTRSTGSDNDFNDLVFYIRANPWEKVDISNMPRVTPEDDCDNDGVSDASDDFPCDPARAVRNTYTGTLSYEDLWPSQGDYDFNDMVVDYEIDHILNGANQLVEIEADWTVRAVGAAYENGFGFTFDGLDPNVISSVNGHNLTKNLISNANNGVEAGQSSATIITFDNVFDVIQNPGTPFINTVIGATKANPVTVSQLISFSNPQVQAQVGLPPYNPFIFVNGDRGREVHLANKMPTDLADPSNFGRHSDATDLNAGYTYKAENGMPWAINISESFDYPIEYTSVDEAYLFFSTWAISGGSSNADWFTDAIGNRDLSKIYQ